MYICVGNDASKLEVSSVHSAPAEHGAPRLPDVGVGWSACLSCGMVVLLVMTGCRLFHILMVLGKKDVLNTWGKSTYNDSESDSGRLFDSESDSSQFGYDSESDSDASNISIIDSDSESDSDSNFQLLI